MPTDYSITKYFGSNLAEMLSSKILKFHPSFKSQEYINSIQNKCDNLSYTQRIILHANELKKYLPVEFVDAIDILMKILGDENPNQTGMFTNYYWIMPIGKFVELYGLEDFEVSMKAIEEITKRNTGEYAIRPFIRKYPAKTVEIMESWSKSNNFHLRRLSSEGCRPKLPWSTKLDEFIDKPESVFKILANLMEDDIKFVQKSVANNIIDYLKVNKIEAVRFIRLYENSSNKNTQWILKHATRKIKIN
jgi:3-methyladenine DNA glycosylase AlkC